MSNPKPLCRKSFLAKTVIDMEVLRRHAAGQPPSDTSIYGTQKSLEQRDLEWFARTIWQQTYDLHSLANSARGRQRDWSQPYWSVANDLGKEPHIGQMVIVNDAQFGARHAKGVGQLIQIEREPRRYGGRRLYEDDGGPAYMSSQYVLRLLDGREINWYNASIVRVPDHRYLKMCRDVYEKVYG